jgi:ferritin-like metal-binding protein YciE
MDTHEQIITWLRDAHAMERSMESVLERHIADAAEQPLLRERLERHLVETRQHAQRVEGCLEALNATPSTTKDLAANFLGALQGMSSALFRDEVVKNTLAEYAMEHFEIACYSSLIAAAENAGLIDLAHTCSELLREEAAMAIWLEDEIPKITRRYLEQPASVRTG